MSWNYCYILIILRVDVFQSPCVQKASSSHTLNMTYLKVRHWISVWQLLKCFAMFPLSYRLRAANLMHSRYLWRMGGSVCHFTDLEWISLPEVDNMVTKRRFHLIKIISNNWVKIFLEGLSKPICLNNLNDTNNKS